MRSGNQSRRAVGATAFTRIRLAMLLACVAALAACTEGGRLAPVGSRAEAIPPACDQPTWVGAWATSVQTAGRTGQWNTGFADQTLRMMVRPQVGGSAVRLHFANTYGAHTLTFDSVYVGLQGEGAEVRGSNHQVTFGGRPQITLTRGGKAVSDPVPLTVAGGEHLAVSFHAPEVTGPPTAHFYGLTTSYVSQRGDHAADASADPYTQTTTSWFYLAGVDVLAPRPTGAVVALGDSITDGTGSTTDADTRWPDYLAARLRAEDGGPRLSVLNHGIGANQILTDVGVSPATGENALARFDRDVLAQTGVTDLILLEGINDINLGMKTGEEVIAGIQQIAARARAAGLNALVGTLTPNGPQPERDKVNEWIRSTDAIDGYVDFDAAVRDPDNPDNWREGTSNDNLHGNDAGYELMGHAVDLQLLEGRPCE